MNFWVKIILLSSRNLMKMASKQYKKIVQTEIITKIDANGEITEQETGKLLQFPSEPPFFKTYSEDLIAILGLPVGLRAVLPLLLREMNYKNIITLSTRGKKEIVSNVRITLGTLDNYLVALTKASVFQRIGRSEYFVNPNHFARGEWVETIKKRRNWELVVTYDSKTGERISIEGKTKRSSDKTNNQT